jgi:hypothetical protein
VVAEIAAYWVRVRSARPPANETANKVQPTNINKK